MLRSPLTRTLVFLSLLPLAACGKGEDKPDEKADKKPETKAEPAEKVEPEPDVPEAPAIDTSGPKPPEVSAVFFAVDGAMLAIACYDKDKKELRGGTDCRSLVPDGEEVVLGSEYAKNADKIAGPKLANCEFGDKPTSLGTKLLDDGRTFEWAVWPKSVMPLVTQTESKTWSDSGSELSAEETAAAEAAVAKVFSRKGDFRPAQRAEADVDGDGKPELFISAVVGKTGKADEHIFGGLFMAPGGDLGSLTLVDRSKKNIIHLRGVVDLDGDGKKELWLGINDPDGGTADRVFKGDANKFEAVGPWSCGFKDR